MSSKIIKTSIRQLICSLINVKNVLVYINYYFYVSLNKDDLISWK